MRLYAFEVRWAELCGRTLCPAGILGGAVDDLRVGELYHDECRTSPWYVALLLRLSLWIAWLSPLWMQGRLRTLGGVSASERTQLFESLLASRHYYVRLATLFLKLTVCSVLFGDERALVAIGAYDLVGPPLLGLRRAP